MNKDTLLQMTIKEIEKFLNDNIVNITETSTNSSGIKGTMIETIKKVFDDSVEVKSPYYTNREIVIRFGRVNIFFNVGSKITGETVEVSRLRKTDILQTGKFSFKRIEIHFYNPIFDGDDLDNYKVKTNSYYQTGGPEIVLKEKNIKLCELFTKDNLMKEIQSQDEEWKNIKKEVILSASQPKIKQEYFNSNFNQDRWDEIINKTFKNNKELIEGEIEKIFNIL